MTEITLYQASIHEVLHTHIFKEAALGRMDADYLKDWHKQHNKIASDYRQVIKDGLKEVYGNKFTDKQYETLSWSGLEETDAYESTFNTQEKKDEHIKALSNLYWKKIGSDKPTGKGGGGPEDKDKKPQDEEGDGSEGKETGNPESGGSTTVGDE